MFDTIPQLIEANDKALIALNQCLARLREFMIGSTTNTRARLRAQIGRITSEIELVQIVNTHLSAATVEFTPLSVGAKSQLQDAFDKIDRAIVSNMIIDAGIETINDIVATASKIGDITNGANA
jgi:hypothetical protein